MITPYPVRYRAAVRIINRAARPVFIRDIRLRVAARTLSPGTITAKRLDPDDYADLDITFPVSDKDMPAEAGRFSIQVIPTRGRTARAGGQFPQPPRSGASS